MAAVRSGSPSRARTPGVPRSRASAVSSATGHVGERSPGRGRLDAPVASRPGNGSSRPRSSPAVGGVTVAGPPDDGDDAAHRSSPPGDRPLASRASPEPAPGTPLCHPAVDERASRSTGRPGRQPVTVRPLDRGDEPVATAAAWPWRGGLDHHPHERLGAARAHEHPAGLAQLRLGGRDLAGRAVRDLVGRSRDAARCAAPAAAGSSTAGELGERSARRAMTSSSWIPVSRPSPVVARSRKMTWPDCSPPSDQPPSSSASST